MIFSNPFLPSALLTSAPPFFLIHWNYPALQHPSTLSANRGFLGNGHFKQANDWLEAKYGADGRVDWCTL